LHINPLEPRAFRFTLSKTFEPSSITISR
jgi:hypothetical protein